MLIPLKKNYGHVRNEFGFHSKKIMITSEIMLDSTHKNLWLHQKWFWILLKKIMVTSEMILDSSKKFFLVA